MIPVPHRSPVDAASVLRDPALPTLVLAGDPSAEGAWPSLAAVERSVATTTALDGLDATVRRRRARGGPGGTGVAAVFAYESTELPIVLEVEASLVGGRLAAIDAAAAERAAARLRGAARRPLHPARASGALRTSLPREAYEARVAEVRERIARGDLYQANLTQRFDVPLEGDPLELWERLLAAGPLPRAAFFEQGGTALVSLSPEVFVDVDRTGLAVTRPIKGTRPRGTDAASDASAARALLASAKDRAELVMIVDLERNDLGRICETGSVVVPEVTALHSFPAVHHLVARVEGRLRPDVGPAALVRAVFPGGSITGAPKLRAIEVLAELEPVPRGWYTGSLFWFDDDGSTASSILIRSVVVHEGIATIGAGGGVTADSEPRAEWEEANAKARPILRALGREPEEAR